MFSHFDTIPECIHSHASIALRSRNCYKLVISR